MKAKITIDEMWATLDGVPIERVESVVAPLHPKRQYSREFKEGLWDGRERLHTGQKFPAGLVDRVVGCLEQEGIESVVRDLRDEFEYAHEKLTTKLLLDVQLRDYQLAAAKALLEAGGGILTAPTGSGKSLIAAAVLVHLWREFEMPGLIIVPKRGLAHQMVKTLLKVTKGVRVGQWGDGQHVIGDITVATAAALHAGQKAKKHRPGVRRLEEETEALFADETHHAATADSWYSFCFRCRAHFRAGMSATPVRSGDEIAGLKLEAAVGKPVYEVSGSELAERGTLAKPKIVMVMSDNASVMTSRFEVKKRGKKWKKRKDRDAWMTVSRERLFYQDAYNLLVVEGKEHNDAVVMAVRWLARHKRRTLIIGRRLKQLVEIGERLDQTKVRYRIVTGATDTREREYVQSLLTQGRIDCILASVVYDEGVDTPAIDAIVLAEGVSTDINALQRIGRGMRKKKGANDLWAVDFAPVGHPVLLRHAYERCQAYESREYDVRVLEFWPRKAKKLPDDLLPFEEWS